MLYAQNFSLVSYTEEAHILFSYSPATAPLQQVAQQVHSLLTFDVAWTLGLLTEFQWAYLYARETYLIVTPGMMILS